MTSNHFEIINIPGGIKVYNDRNFIDEILQKEEKNSLSDKWVQIIYFINDSVYKWVPTDWYIN